MAYHYYGLIVFDLTLTWNRDRQLSKGRKGSSRNDLCGIDHPYDNHRIVAPLILISNNANHMQSSIQSLEHRSFPVVPTIKSHMADTIHLEPPSRGLKNKVAIVTGAGCTGDGIGNGRAISILLSDEGCHVLCLDRNLSWATKTAEMCNSKPNRGLALPFQADVTSSQDCSKAVDFALEKWGRLDVLVNNVGIAGAPGTVEEVQMEEWAKGLEINVTSMVVMSKFAVPAMKKNEGEVRGSIVNLGSVAGLKGGTPHLLYPTSKGAVVNMTRAMAAHHAQDGIRVNCVCPGVCLMSSCSMFRRMLTDNP